jgi:prepilin-type N-terminal cleavage/methylation domain-containing protein
MRNGFTVVELSITVALVALTASLTLPRFTTWRDRIAVDVAASSSIAVLATARHAALRRAAVTAVRIDTAAGRLLVHSGSDTIELRPLGQVHGVRLATTRDSIAFGPGGLGFGAANTRLILARGSAAETVLVSRLGRARR